MKAYLDTSFDERQSNVPEEYSCKEPNSANLVSAEGGLDGYYDPELRPSTLNNIQPDTGSKMSVHSLLKKYVCKSTPEIEGGYASRQSSNLVRI